MLTSAHPLASRRVSISLAGAAVFALALSACATASPSDDTSSNDAPSNEVTLVVHDSFPNDEFAAAASAATGYDVRVISAGDGGELTSQLVLTQAAPIADAFFGVDNVFVSRLLDAGVADESAVDVVPVTLGATCINIDPAWFTEQGIAEPTSYEDLADETYRGLTVLLDPTTSTTGASFLIGTVSRFGEPGFAEYWQQLAENEVRIEQGWSAAYNGQFTQGGESGTYPIVLSYSSSPAWTVTEDGSATTTKALLDTCSSQIEYAGVLAGSANPEGGAAVVEYMLSREFQATIADTMYVYPADDAASIPADWERFAPLPIAPHDLTPSEIGAGREPWLRAWSDATGW